MVAFFFFFFAGAIRDQAVRGVKTSDGIKLTFVTVNPPDSALTH